MEFRIGQGVDIHAFQKGRKLILGGVQIPCEFGLEGHSDADVVIHSLMDSYLGALGQKDIGFFFPPTDIRYKNISSIILLKKILSMDFSLGWIVNNLDITILAQKPKILPFSEKMKDVICKTVSISSDRCSIKATTTETLGFVGREEGILASTVISLIKY